MGISMLRRSKTLANLGAVAAVATALPAASIVWGQAQAQKGQDEPPRDVKKVELKVEIAPLTKIQVAPAKDAAPGLLLEKTLGLRLALPMPPGALPAPPAATLEPMTQQMIQQLRPLFRAEFRVLTSACEPSTSQRREVALEGGRAVKDLATKLATVQHALQNGGWRGGAFPDARKSIREGLLAAARSHLTPEQVARYQDELEQKVKDQRKVVVLNLVANLDRLLFLSPAQRDKIGETLLSNWNDQTFPVVENLANYETYFPVLPEKQIAPLLNDAQRSTWNGVQKVTFGQSFNFNFNNGLGGGPGDEDDDEKAAMAEAVRKK